jgi:chromosome partitioning protein
LLTEGAFGNFMIIAIYSSKGGVGKTTLAVNLAWASATQSQRKTLLWDLDAQGAASYILGQHAFVSAAKASITKDADVDDLIRPSNIPGVDVLPADDSLRTLDYAFHELGKRKRLAKITAHLGHSYDRIIIDCPPGLTDTSDQILRAAGLAVVPVIPSALSQRSLDVIRNYVGRKRGPKVTLVPVFSMVDRRRALHQAELNRHSGWPSIPMASAYEKMSEERKPIGEIMARSSPPVAAVTELWRKLEKAMSKIKT